MFLKPLQCLFALSEVQTVEMYTVVFSSVLYRDVFLQDSVLLVYLENIRVTGSCWKFTAILYKGILFYNTLF